MIPAFNAENTLLETLQSVAAQTHSELQIIIVDDGSVDNTALIARAFGQTDPRVSFIQKPNGGVASARNAGIRASSGEFIAFIDADDLWHPTKIAKQLALLIASSKETALVYSPFRQINAKGMVMGSSRNHRVEGWVINRHFYVNPIGNGSSILIRKDVLDEMGGYSSILWENNAQGCEDLLLQLRVALRYRFATVPEYLVGYRNLPGNMSSDEERMLRSAILAYSIVLAECPSFAELEDRGVVARTLWEYLKIIALRPHFRQGFKFLWPHLKGRASLVAKAAWIVNANKLIRLYHRIATLPERQRQAKIKISYRHFYEYDPADMSYSDHSPMVWVKEEADEIYRNLVALVPLDTAYRPENYLTRYGQPSPDTSSFMA